MPTVLIAGGGTGGHLMPALAIGEAVQTLHPDWRVVYAGARRGIEARVLPERGLPHHLLPMEPLYRRQWWRNARWPLLLWPLLRRIDAMLEAERPAAVIGTGGYASGPVVWRATRRGIPTGVLDLDVQPGLTTRWLSRRVDEVWLAAPEGVSALRRGRGEVSVTGAPITPPDPARRASALMRLGLSGERPVLVVTGGSQGSRAINLLVAEWLQSGKADGVDLLWSAGGVTYPEFAGCHAPPHVIVAPFIDPMADAWAVADLCVARSGMMTLSELCAWAIPSILIPLPTAAADHQSHNAAAMAAAGAARILPQAGLTAAELGEAIRGLLEDPAGRAAMSGAAGARGRPHAASDLAARVSALVDRGAPAARSS